MPPPVFVCCWSDIAANPTGKVNVEYDAAKGFLLRPEACGQRLQVDFAQYNPNAKVTSFHYGPFDCPDSEQWDLYSDCTIRPRHHSNFALGTGQGRGGKTQAMLVAHDDPRRLVFSSVQRQVAWLGVACGFGRGFGCGFGFGVGLGVAVGLGLVWSPAACSGRWPG